MFDVQTKYNSNNETLSHILFSLISESEYIEIAQYSLQRFLF
jgi:hypothetical protein